MDVWEVGGREDEIGMIDQVGLAVSHVNGEGPKWSGCFIGLKYSAGDGAGKRLPVDTACTLLRPSY
jgi:hypothetical protein